MIQKKEKKTTDLEIIIMAIKMYGEGKKAKVIARNRKFSNSTVSTI